MIMTIHLTIVLAVEGGTGCCTGGGIFLFGVLEICSGIDICASENRLLG